MKKSSCSIQISYLPVKTKDQKERWLNLVKIEIDESVPDHVVKIYMDKTKAMVSLVVTLATLSDPSFPLKYDLSLPEGTPSIRFNGSHRVAYATVDAYM